MRNLIQLFARYGGFLVFLILESLCFVLIVRFNEEQKAIYVSSVSNFTGTIDQKTDEIGDYFHLSRINDSLANENARLYEELFALRRMVQPADSSAIFPAHRQYRIVKSEVIYNALNRNNNYLILDKGSRDSIRSHMGVFSRNGVVGIVREVNPNFSLVMSILHREARISASIRQRNYFGSLVWDEHDHRKMVLQNIPKHAQASRGDTVQTSGYSTIFPGGIPIGVVSAVRTNQSSSFHDIEVDLFIDMGKVDYVYVIQDSLSQQKAALQSIIDNE